MEDSEIQKRIMNLGKALVKELNLENSVDTLARWMAHYIAEQIEAAEHSIGIEKKEFEERCFETILKLWKHRSHMPKGVRPFENFEPILRVLKRLDPENERYFFFEDRYKESEDIPYEVQKWLDVANEIDETARVWLRYVFEQAVKSASDEKTFAWLKNSVDIEDSEEILIINDLLYDSEIQKNEEELKQMKKEKIISSINKLERFTELNEFLLLEYRQTLDKIETP